MKKGKKYSVYWIDTFSYQGWWTEEDIKKKSKENAEYLETIGIYMGEYFGFIILASSKQNMDDFPEWGYPKWIPRGCVKKIKEIK